MIKKILNSKLVIFCLGSVLGAATVIASYKTGVSAAKEHQEILLGCIGSDGIEIVKDQAEKQRSIKPIFDAAEECKKLLKSV